MSDASYQLKFNYTTGNEFLLSGNDYVGFFNVYSDGTVYTDKFRSSTSQPLERLSKFSTDYHVSSHYKDLMLNDAYALPYSMDDVVIGMGEIVNFTTINTKFKYLHQNLLYVYSKMFHGDTDVPVNYDATAGISNKNSTEYNWSSASNYTGYGHTTFAASTGIPGLSAYTDMDNLKRLVVVPSTYPDMFSIFGITDTRLVALTSNTSLTNIGITLYTNVIDEQSSEECQNLNDITYDGKYLYVSDSSINSGGQVFKYDVPSYNTGDAAFEHKRFMIRPVGGLGGMRDTNKFRGCSVLGSKPGVILVADSGNDVIKIFTRDLVWIKTIALPKGNYRVLDIRHRAINDCFYFLAEDVDNKKFMMFVYNSAYRFVEQVVFEDILYPDVDNVFNRMILSEQDSNVFYLSTESTVYKKFFSNPTKTFATFKRDKFGQSPIFKWHFETLPWNSEQKKWNQNTGASSIKLTDLSILPTNTNTDSLFVLGSGVIFHFNERSDYLTVLRDPKLDYYSFDKVKLEQTENIQAITINKELYKMFINIIQLKNNLLGRFYMEYNFYGETECKGYRYFLDKEIDQLNVELDYNTKVNANELVQTGTINKIFTRMYNLHQTMLELTKPVVTNFKAVVTNLNVMVID